MTDPVKPDSPGPSSQRSQSALSQASLAYGRTAPVLFLLACAVGLFVGVGVFTFGYGKGGSYLSNDPNACANCHVMQNHLDTWQKSSHHATAVCNDCHLEPHPVKKWITKADNGFFHSVAFTLGDYKDPIRIKPRNRRVTQSACLGCHQEFVHAMLPARPGEKIQNCVHCHQDVGHAGR